MKNVSFTSVLKTSSLRISFSIRFRSQSRTQKRNTWKSPSEQTENGTKQTQNIPQQQNQIVKINCDKSYFFCRKRPKTLFYNLNETSHIPETS